MCSKVGRLCLRVLIQPYLTVAQSVMVYIADFDTVAAKLFFVTDNKAPVIISYLPINQVLITNYALS